MALGEYYCKIRRRFTEFLIHNHKIWDYSVQIFLLSAFGTILNILSKNIQTGSLGKKIFYFYNDIFGFCYYFSKHKLLYIVR